MNTVQPNDMYSRRFISIFMGLYHRWSIMSVPPGNFFLAGSRYRFSLRQQPHAIIPTLLLVTVHGVVVFRAGSAGGEGQMAMAMRQRRCAAVSSAQRPV